MPRKPFPWRMGGDPEFSILLDGKRCDAITVFKHFRKEKDTETSSQGFTEPGMKGDIGWDGCNATAEIRPHAANTVDEFIENIRSLLTPTLSKLPPFDFSTLSVFAPIGGHIHLDLPDGFGNVSDDPKVQKLKRQLVSFYLPIMLSENPVSQAIRLKNYGKLGDHHTDRMFRIGDKTIRTFEFRTPSAEWLTSPKIATAVLAYITVIWHECITHPENVDKWKNLAIKTEKQMEALQTIANSNYAALTAMLMAQIRRAIKTFEFYPEYKKEIDWLFTPKNVLKEKSKVNYDPSVGWGLRKGKEVNKKEFLTKGLLDKANALNGLSLDFCATNIIIPYNDDFKVQPFANALAERMASYGWKPKNNYYFFGLKKGTDHVLVGNEKNQIAFGKHEFQSEEGRVTAINAIARMTERAKEKYAERESLTVNVESGRLERKKREVIVFGLPHDIRNNGKTKPILEAIWKIEKAEVKFETPKVVAPETLPKDAAPEQIVEILDNEDENLIDHDSQGAQFALQAIRDLTAENGSIIGIPNSSLEEWNERLRREFQYVSFLSNRGNGYGWLMPEFHTSATYGLSRRCIVIDRENSPMLMSGSGWTAQRNIEITDLNRENIPPNTPDFLFVDSFTTTRFRPRTTNPQNLNSF